MERTDKQKAGKKRVILVTDGDRVAERVIEMAAKKLGLRTISRSGGNPTPISGKEIVDLIMEAPKDPVLVMVDDRGKSEKWKGERALERIAKDPKIEVLGVVAIASHTHDANGSHVDVSVTAKGELVDGPVNKEGVPDEKHGRLKGDTVDVLEDLTIPVIVGEGDPGKQDGADWLSKGAPLTMKAIEEILRRNDIEAEGLSGRVDPGEH
ncbi:MAG TPA: stage V sporulation protein AE [Bacillota bacterium]|jgi:stage V sporulation protein AE